MGPSMCGLFHAAVCALLLGAWLEPQLTGWLAAGEDRVDAMLTVPAPTPPHSCAATPSALCAAQHWTASSS